jgi:hypothetical protein
MKRKNALFAAAVLVAVIGLIPGAAQAQAVSPASPASPEDEAGIRQAALDYIEGYYEGSAERMTRALHPDLAKRIVRVENGQSRVAHMSADQLIQVAGSGSGKKVPVAEQQKDITILDVYGNASVVKLVARDWVDYLQIAKVDGRWVIVNVLWEMKPKPAQ